MKTKVLAFTLCACLVLFVFSGCGMKMPDNSGASPSGSAEGSPSDGTATGATTVTGIVTFVDNETITFDVVSSDGAQFSEGAETVSVGSTTYVMTGGTQSVAPDAGTAVIFENQGFAQGTLDGIKAGDFVAVLLRGNTVTAVIDAGHAQVSNTGSEGVQPGVEPTDSSAEPSSGIPDTSEPAAYTVITDGLKVRSGPGIEYNALGILDTGSRVTGTITDGWLQFTYNGETAYCSAQYLVLSTAPEGVSDSSESKTYKTTDNLMARSGPGTTFSSLGTLQKDTEVTGTVLGGWLKFTYNEKTAYCNAAYLTEG
jgi:uncharacterized protein YgiM (DUF1202 family)